MNDRRPFKRVRTKDRWIGGVCGGFAYALKIPVLWIRIAFIVLFAVFTNPYVAYVGSAAFWVYVLCWIFAPEWESDLPDYEARTS